MSVNQLSIPRVDRDSCVPGLMSLLEIACYASSVTCVVVQVRWYMYALEALKSKASGHVVHISEFPPITTT